MTAEVSPRRWRRRWLVRLLIVAGVLVALFGGAGIWLYRALPRIVAAELGRWMNARVETGAFHPHRDGSVTVEGLVIRPNQDEFLYENTILRADRVYAKFDRRSLLSLSPRVTAIGIESFLLDVQLNVDTGRWNIGALRFNAPRGGGGEMPQITLKQGKLRYCRSADVRQEVVMSIPVEAHFGPDPDGNPGYAFALKTATQAGGYGASNLTGRWQPCITTAAPGVLTLAGGLSTTDIPSLERAWAVETLAGELRYDMAGQYSLKLNLGNVHGRQAPEINMLGFIDPAIKKSGPIRSLQKFFAEYQPTGTVGSISLQTSGNIKKIADSEIEGKLVCQDISVCDNEFPYRLDHLAGTVEFTQSSVHLNKLVGRHGPVAVQVDGWVRESAAGRQYQYQITSRNMILDNDLRTALNPEEQQWWDAFRPTGTVAVDYRLTRTSPTDKRLYLSVDLNDVTATFQGFPYPVTGLTGNLFFSDAGLAVSDVVSQAGGRQIRLNGKVTRPIGGEPKYYLSVEAKGIPLDGTLRDALPSRYRAMFDQLDINGLADMRARVFSTDDPNGTAQAQAAVLALAGAGAASSKTSRRVALLADVSCKDCSLKLPSACPEPAGAADAGASKPRNVNRTVAGPGVVLSHIAAQMTITPDSVNLRQLDGRHGRSPVAMTGGIMFGADNKLKDCRLQVTARQVPLDQTTIGLLPPAFARQVAAFRPEGDVDLTVEMKKADSNEPPAYTIVVNCLGDQINHERFPYPLQDIHGTVTFAQERLVLKNVVARPDEGVVANSAGQGAIVPDPPSATEGPARTPSSLLRVDGSLSLGPGPVQGSFSLKATDLLLTEKLGRALPQTLADTYRQLSPQGPFDLDLTTVKVSPGASEETIVEFGGRANLKNCRVQASGAALEVAGALQAEGSYSTRAGLARGLARLAAERLTVKGKTATRTEIEAIYDPNAGTWTADNFVGDCYGGRLLGDLAIGVPEGNRPPAADAGPKTEPATADRSRSSDVEYRLRVGFHDVDLQQFLLAGKPQDTGSKAQGGGGPSSGPVSAATGTMDASLSLRGRMGGSPRAESGAGDRGERPTRRGDCHIDIVNMQVGKVSALGRILSVLRLSEPSDYTFERMQIDSYIRDDRLLISRLDLSGKNAAFTGVGTMDLPTDEVNLTLNARGPRVAALGPSVLQSLTEGLGGAVMRIEVTGRADSPHVQTKTLPLIEDSLRILGAPEENRRGKK